MAAPAPSTPATPAQLKSEDILSAKTDLCLSNAIVKAGTGLAVGVVASALLFRRRPWPVLLGLGFGAGQGYSDCERVFNPAAIPGYRIAGQDKAASPFTLSSPFSSVSPSQSSAPAPSPSPAPAAESVSVKVQDAVSSAKSKASDAASAAQEKASEVVDQAKDTAAAVEVKAEKKVDELKEGKKWV
ncbi:hypothetical protein JCM5296_002086 [Sporobolomyces johnsonii]